MSNMPTNSGSSIMIVDDVQENIVVLRETLATEGYRLSFATSGEKALEIIPHVKPDLILLDVTMPGIDGFETCRRLKADPETNDIPVIFITARREVEDIVTGLDAGSTDYITKPFRYREVRARVRTQLDLRHMRKALESQNKIISEQNLVLEHKVRERTRELQETRLEIINRLGRASEYRDNQTGMHIIRIGYFAALLGRAAGLSEIDCERLLHAAPMHDIGKIGIPDAILLKPGALSPAEREIMKTHTTIGAHILSGSNYEIMKSAEVIALSHHEQWNGGGYPNGLRGDKIPLEGRIVALADTFDALTSERPYKKSWAMDATLEKIDKSSGVLFDPELVAHFKRITPEIVEIKKRLADSLDSCTIRGNFGFDGLGTL